MAHRCFSLTINNPKSNEIEFPVSVRYCKWQLEEAKTTKTPHLQCCVIYNYPVRVSQVIKDFPGAHVEVAQKELALLRYVSKSDTYVDGPWEYGDCPLRSNAAKAGGDAEKARWKRAREAAQSGKFDEVPDDIYIKYKRALHEIAKEHMVKPADVDAVTGVWLYGDPGCGKSRAVSEVFPAAYKKMQNKWWDGYQNEEVVWLDDYDSKELGHLLKIWADRYSFLAETKGGAIHIRPKLFVITSNYPPSHDRFAWDTDLVKAIERRFKLFHVFNFEGLCDRLRAIPLPRSVSGVDPEPSVMQDQ